MRKECRMDSSWEERDPNDELKDLKEGRQYIIFIPNPEDDTNFSVMIADTVPITKEGDLSYKESYANVSMLIVKGMVFMLNNDLEYLLERGEEVMDSEYIEAKKDQFKNIENVVVFKPKDTKH
jgi:hypothetical protein